MSNNLYIIILNWNGSSDTIECLESVKKSDIDDFTIVLIDNGSEIEELKKIKIWCKNNFHTFVNYTREEAEIGGKEEEQKKINNLKGDQKIVFIENNSNLGFAAGNNVGLKYAIKNKILYTLLLNNDTIVEKESIRLLKSFMDNNPKMVACTPQIRYFSNKDTIWNCGGKIIWAGNRKYFYHGKKISKVPQIGSKRITFVTGCALFFIPSKTDILSEKYFFGEEDLEFSYRLKKRGLKIACVFSSIIYHKVSMSANKTRKNTIGIVYINYISRFINIRDNSSHFSFKIKFILNLLYIIPMIKIRYKFSVKQIYNISKTLINELKVRNSIDKKYTQEFLVKDFK